MHQTRHGQGYTEMPDGTWVRNQRPREFPLQEPVTEDGYTEWVCPKPDSYLMKCCDCGLVHELQFRVASYQPRPSEEFTALDNPDLQVQFRARRHPTNGS